MASPSRLGRERTLPHPCSSSGWVAVFLAGLVSLLLVRPAQAAPGDLDVSFAGFGTSGEVALPDPTWDMVRQPDGKLLVLSSEITVDTDIVLRRYLPDGTLDATFGSGSGRIVFSLGVSVIGKGLAIQPDGKIVVAGQTHGPPDDDYLVVRFTASGALDQSFGGGYRITDIAGDFPDVAFAVSIAADGNIIVAGSTILPLYPTMSIACYSPAGSLLWKNWGYGATYGWESSQTSNVIAQSDGKILLVGSASIDGNHQFAVFRLNPDGSRDETYSGGGHVTTSFGSDDLARGAKLQPDGKLLVVGDDGSNARIARYNSDGSLDGSFDGDGKRSLILNGGGSMRDILTQPDGRIVILGHSGPTDAHDLHLFRMSSTGALDFSWGGDGDRTIDLGGDEQATSLTLEPDGRLTAAASLLASSASTGALVRFWPDGSLDTGGLQTVGFDDPGRGPGSNAASSACVFQPDGKLVLVGTIQDAGYVSGDFGVTRLLPDGEPDVSFGLYGRATFPFDQPDYATSVALQTDGKIVVAGFTQGSTNNDFMLVRFNSDGSVDGSFGFLGIVVLDFLGGHDYGNAVAIAPDGKIVVAGTVFNGARYVYGVARLNTNGSRDLTFDVDGKQLLEFSVGPSHWATSVLVQPDLKIIEGGHVGANFALARFNANGSVDTSFGASGKETVDFGGNDYLNALALASNGWIYGAGSSDANGNNQFALLQLQANGIPPGRCTSECGHWSNGKAFVSFSSDAAAFAIDVRDDGKVVAAGIAGSLMAWGQRTATRNIETPLTAT
ncbi:MAG: hypothetical protein KC729_17760, partial [Candidatus Eisenbacteria bacterium]|nr:hypothetical protein [Candidatus Eisenbacteria bacterium]